MRGAGPGGGRAGPQAPHRGGEGWPPFGESEILSGPVAPIPRVSVGKAPFMAQARR